MEKATFAGGCFWCMVTPFEEQPGIHGIISGYAGGSRIQHMSRSKPGDRSCEVVEITFDPDVFPYERLLELYWPQIDPTDDGGQFQDRGAQYRTAIFVHNERQRELAEQSKQELAASGRSLNPLLRKLGCSYILSG